VLHLLHGLRCSWRNTHHHQLMVQAAVQLEQLVLLMQNQKGQNLPAL